MSSGNASSDMARKQVELDLAGGKLVVKGVEVLILNLPQFR
jgi:hypothetical protein